MQIAMVGLERWKAVFQQKIENIEEFGNKSAPAHHTLLGAGIIIIEGLNLSGVKEGEYKVMCAPLKIKGGDGSPARVFLEKQNSKIP